MNFNPFQFMGGFPPKQNPRPFQSQSQPQINPQQFKQLAPNITQDMLVQLARQALAQGISEQEIEAGINFIQQLK